MASDPKDYYALLGVSPDATLETIKLAYRRLARASHPDMVSIEGAVAERDAARRMADLNEAYAVLSREPHRADYDRMIGGRSEPRKDGVGSRMPERDAGTDVLRAESRGRAKAGSVVVDNVVGAFLGHVQQELVGSGSSGTYKSAEIEGFDWVAQGKGLLVQEWIAVRGFHTLDLDHVRRFRRYAERARAETRGRLRSQRMLFVLAFYRIEDADAVLDACRRIGVGLKRDSRGDSEAFLVLADVAMAKLMPMANLERARWVSPLLEPFRVHSRSSRKR